MKFELTIPDPATLKTGKVSYVELSGGTVLHRIHPTSYKPNEFNGTDKGNARFSPIRDAAGAIVPTIYGAQSFECAACEIILRCPDFPATIPSTVVPTLPIVYPVDYRDYSHSAVETTTALTLVDLTIAGQRKIGVNANALLAGPKSTYGATRRWAEAIHTSCLGAQGIYYGSFQYGPQFAVVLFGDRVARGALKPISTRLIADAPCHSELRAIADSLSIEYEDV